MGYIIRHSRNLAALAGSIVTDPPTEIGSPGQGASRLKDGLVGLTWQAQVATDARITLLDLPSASYNAVAVFGLEPTAHQFWGNTSIRSLTVRVRIGGQWSLEWGATWGWGEATAVSAVTGGRKTYEGLRLEIGVPTPRLLTIGEVVIGHREAIPTPVEIETDRVEPAIINGDRREPVGAPFRRLRVTFPPAKTPLDLPSEPVAWWPTEEILGEPSPHVRLPADVLYGRFLPPYTRRRSSGGFHYTSAVFEEMRRQFRG